MCQNSIFVIDWTVNIYFDTLICRLAEEKSEIETWLSSTAHADILFKKFALSDQ